jgi:hypothetical protein
MSTARIRASIAKARQTPAPSLQIQPLTEGGFLVTITGEDSKFDADQLDQLFDRVKDFLADPYKEVTRGRRR